MSGLQKAYEYVAGHEYPKEKDFEKGAKLRVVRTTFGHGDGPGGRYYFHVRAGATTESRGRRDAGLYKLDIDANDLTILEHKPQCKPGESFPSYYKWVEASPERNKQLKTKASYIVWIDMNDLERVEEESTEGIR